MVSFHKEKEIKKSFLGLPTPNCFSVSKPGFWFFQQSPELSHNRCFSGIQNIFSNYILVSKKKKKTP